MNVDAVVYFRIYDPIKSVKNVANAQFSTRLLAATTLRNTLGINERQSFTCFHIFIVFLKVQRHCKKYYKIVSI